MKKLIIFVFVFSNLGCYSQDFINTVAKESCECIHAKKIDFEKLTAEQLQSEFGVCIVKSYSQHKEAYDKIEKLDFSNRSDMKALGEKVAIKMLEHCPEVIIAIGKSSNNEFSDDEDTNEDSVDLTLEGQLIEQKNDQFISLIVKDNAGRTHSLLFLSFFENSNLITENLLKKNDKISIDYFEQEFYDIKSKDFRYYKVITKIVKK
ncbi:hypothetical protein D3C86_478300 [compost metagenome]